MTLIKIICLGFKIDMWSLGPRIPTCSLSSYYTILLIGRCFCIALYSDVHPFVGLLYSCQSTLDFTFDRKFGSVVGVGLLIKNGWTLFKT